MDEAELEQCRALLGVTASVTAEELERAYMKKSFSVIKGKAGAADEANPDLDARRQSLRSAYEKLALHLQEKQRQAAAATTVPRKAPQLTPMHAPPPTTLKGIVTPPVVELRDPADDQFVLFRFNSWGLNMVMPPLLLALVWLATKTFVGPLMFSATVCVHEFGHATGAWLSGWRATPLPWGWTPVEPVHSNFVYFGLLALLGLLFVAGMKERKAWPMLFAVAIAMLQAYMTWVMPEHRKEFWMIFGGIGGEFVLSTLLMMAFWVPLPDKFKWGAVRYLFFLIGAAAFLSIWQRWREIYPGREEIPFGSLINGEDDQNGDMNRLMNEYGWTKFKIRRTYWLLGWWCWAALGLAWLVFALRLNEAGDWVAAKFGKKEG